MGSAAAGPLYAAFPVAAVMLKKGVRLMNVFVFVGAWSTTKIPMLLFEASNLGIRFMLIRLACNIAGITAMAVIMDRTTSESKRKRSTKGPKDSKIPFCRTSLHALVPSLWIGAGAKGPNL
jgi:uncharacterized membrane protein YraQ (UPF0718 family)